MLPAAPSQRLFSLHTEIHREFSQPSPGAPLPRAGGADGTPLPPEDGTGEISPSPRWGPPSLTSHPQQPLRAHGPENLKRGTQAAPSPGSPPPRAPATCPPSGTSRGPGSPVGAVPGMPERCAPRRAPAGWAVAVDTRENLWVLPHSPCGNSGPGSAPRSGRAQHPRLNPRWRRFPRPPRPSIFCFPLRRFKY